MPWLVSYDIRQSTHDGSTVYSVHHWIMMHAHRVSEIKLALTKSCPWLHLKQIYIFCCPNFLHALSGVSLSAGTGKIDQLGGQFCLPGLTI